MRELTSEELTQVGGGNGLLYFLAGWFVGRQMDSYVDDYRTSPQPLFTDTDATLRYGNSFGMY